VVALVVSQGFALRGHVGELKRKRNEEGLGRDGIYMGEAPRRLNS